MWEFITTNWIWILFIGVMIVMHLGHGGHGRRGGDGDHTAGALAGRDGQQSTVHPSGPPTTSSDEYRETPTSG